MAYRMKALRIAGICALSLLAVFGTVMAAFYLDLAGYLATGSQTYESDGAIAGKAIIVYNPGFTGLTDRAVSHVADLLTGRGYEVVTAGVCSRPALNLSGYDLVIIGSPNYGERPTDRVGAFIETMQPDEGTTIGVLCTSAGATTKGADAITARICGKGLTVKAVMTLAMTESAEPAGSEFVDGLLSREG